MSQEITVPDLGDFHDVEVIDVLVKPGDKIEVDTPLLTIETEKATMDVPATSAGVVKTVAIKKGDRVSKGSVMLTLEPAGEAKGGNDQGVGGSQSASHTVLPTAPSSVTSGQRTADSEDERGGNDQGVGGSQKKSEVAAVTSPAATKIASSSPSPLVGEGRGEGGSSAAAAVNEPNFARAHASPSVRRFARELGVDLGRIKGSGIKDRITPDDVKAWVKQTLTSGSSATGGTSLPKVAEVDFSKFGAIEIKPLGRIQKISGPRLQAS